MREDVAKRARERAAEAHERAREAGARAAELAAGKNTDPEAALARSRAAVDRAAYLAKEGYRHAADAEREAARTHQVFAEAMDRQADKDPGKSGELHAEAMKHRQSAEEHLRNAAYDESHIGKVGQD